MAKLLIDARQLDLDGIFRDKIFRLVFKYPGISPGDVAKVLKRDRRTVLSHAARMDNVVIQQGEKGRGRKTRLYAGRSDQFIVHLKFR